jgi:flagellar FliL protein
MLVIIAGIIIFVAVYSFLGAKAADNEKTVIIPTGPKYQTNLKDCNSILLISYQIEVKEDKKLLAQIEERNTEVRSRVLDILRDKTREDIEGTRGKTNLETEILKYYHTLFGEDEILNVFIDDIVVQ